MSTSVKVMSGQDRALNLVSAILLYKSNEGHVYATTHGMQVDATDPTRKVIGPGAPMTRKGLREFARLVDTATAFSGFIPENMLYNSPSMIAWWVPAAIRHTWFTGTERGLGEVSGPAAHPAMVFVARDRDWSVFALSESARPTPSTILCHSPHLNVYAGGSVCTGNVELPAAISVEAIAAYEEAFFRSRFTHPNNANAVKYRGGMRQLWRDQLANPSIEKMVAALKPTKETLASAIKRLAGH